MNEHHHTTNDHAMSNLAALRERILRKQISRAIVGGTDDAVRDYIMCLVDQDLARLRNCAHESAPAPEPEHLPVEEAVTMLVCEPTPEGTPEPPAEAPEPSVPPPAFEDPAPALAVLPSMASCRDEVSRLLQRSTCVTLEDRIALIQGAFGVSAPYARQLVNDHDDRKSREEAAERKATMLRHEMRLGKKVRDMSHEELEALDADLLAGGKEIVAVAEMARPADPPENGKARANWSPAHGRAAHAAAMRRAKEAKRMKNDIYAVLDDPEETDD